MSDTLSCGHPSSLLIRSTESDYQFCELCEVRSERNDAQTMERHYQARVQIMEQALQVIASPLLEADIDEIREEAREALRQQRSVSTPVPAFQDDGEVR